MKGYFPCFVHRGLFPEMESPGAFPSAESGGITGLVVSCFQRRTWVVLCSHIIRKTQKKYCVRWRQSLAEESTSRQKNIVCAWYAQTGGCRINVWKVCSLRAMCRDC